MKNSAERYFTEGEYLVEIGNHQRKYLCLNEIDPEWTVRTFFSTTHRMFKRTTVFFSGSLIVKVIYEERRFLDENTIRYELYNEFDTKLETSDGKILPLTPKGKPKTINPTNIMNITPFGCSFSFVFYPNYANMFISNHRNRLKIAVGEKDRINRIRTKEDFSEFLEWYISTCGESYFKKTERLINSELKIQKIKPGDIFRMEYDRTRYCYGIVLGIVRNIMKWDCFPEKHSFNRLMTQPLMIRLYNIITDDPDMTAEELEKLPLMPMEICSDDNIHYGTHDIIGHKALTPSDIEFNFICTKIFSEDRHKTLFTDNLLLSSGLIKPRPQYKLYIEWGLANTYLQWEDISEELRNSLEDYKCPYGGVSLGISPVDIGRTQEAPMKGYNYRYNLLLPHNADKLKLIFRSLGLPEDTDFDGFARAFGGITAEEYIRLAQK